ncbi:MAG: hypothetical protein CW346_18400, partial [Bacillaceae bacterium]|nr:hypothetical protein [Bacillaceae bacterium]
RFLSVRRKDRCRLIGRIENPMRFHNGTGKNPPLPYKFLFSMAAGKAANLLTAFPLCCIIL